MGSKCEYFHTGEWESPAKHLHVLGEMANLGGASRNKCIVWVPLQCGVPVAERANSYSAAMVMPVKLGKALAMAHPRKWTPISERD